MNKKFTNKNLYENREKYERICARLLIYVRYAGVRLCGEGNGSEETQEKRGKHA